MNHDGEYELPYDFDLVYDIKDVETLRREYREALSKARGIEDLCLAHGLTDLIKEDMQT